MVSSRNKVDVQLELSMPQWGGRRDGAGRKRQSARPSVAHVVRADVREWNPVLVTLRVRDDVPDLRQRPAWASLVRALRSFRGTCALRVVHYSVLSNHLHLMSECSDRSLMSSGMQGLTIRIAKAINRCFDRKGPVFASRYHGRELTTPSAVRHALRYVLLNARHHAAESGLVLPPSWIDPRSTAAIFDGWREPLELRECASDFGTSPARTWLLRVGWRRYGLLAVDDIPGGMGTTIRPREHVRRKPLPIQDGAPLER